MTFPVTRMRRNRADDWCRALVRESALSPADLIWPLFVKEEGEPEPIASLPGVFRYPLAKLGEVVRLAEGAGIAAIALFPVVDPSKKSDGAEEAFNKKSLACRAIATIKQEKLNLGVICDVALDPYTTHGHDGLLIDGLVVNDPTVEVLCKQALVQAEAGCDVIAPSDMMDGRVGAIRQALDQHGHQRVRILSYAAKYASAFYGPFREAIGSKSNLGKADKSTYQMDPANTDEALREVSLDIAEGADMVMVKPGMPYLDVIQRIKEKFQVPTFAYQVSGEYAMMKAASEKGWLDWDLCLLESLIAFKRAGADGVLTYAAFEVASSL